MTAQTLNSAPEPKPAPSAAAQAGRVCLALGAVVLAWACTIGVTRPADRTWVLGLLFCSVALFAVALALQLKRPAQAVHAAAKDGPAASARVEPPRHAQADSTVLAAQSPGPDDAGHRPPAIALPGPPPKPAATAVTGPPASPEATASTGSGPGRSDRPATEAPPDIATLMRSPLADLLLAALCKDPEGARRIFRQAVLQADSSTTPAAARPANEAPRPTHDG